MKRILNGFVLILLFISSSLAALERDFDTDSDPQSPFPSRHRTWCGLCAYCSGRFATKMGIGNDLLALIPVSSRACEWEFIGCKGRTIYSGYISPSHKRYASHLKQHLDYYNNNRNCTCYWPELSQKAAEISNDAYTLFRDLISSTALINLKRNTEEGQAFAKSVPYIDLKSIHSLVVSVIAQQFRFSHYYHACREIEDFAQTRYDVKECAKIKGKLNDILDALYPKFISLYTTCLKAHSNPDIEKEWRFMKLLVRDISGLEDTIVLSQNITESIVNSPSILYAADAVLAKEKVKRKIKKSKKIKKKQKDKKKKDHSKIFEIVRKNEKEKKNNSSLKAYSVDPEILIETGSILNDFLLHEEAIQVLTKSIHLQPLNRDTYLERAAAYFESGELDLALQDYDKAQQLTTYPLVAKGASFAYGGFYFLPENGREFAQGLIVGTGEGAKESTSELVPSLLSSLRGLAHGLWCFACSPKQVSQELLSAAYEIGAYISTRSTQECLELVIPEMRELSLNWEIFDNYTRGKRIGYIIGKYGVDAFASCVTTIGGVRVVQMLKKANTTFTLEMCLSNTTNRITILEESTKLATARKTLVETARKHKILIRSSNVEYHVMQSKHGWDKLIPLTEDIKENFTKVATLLEEHCIIDEKYIVGKPKSFPLDNRKIIITNYKKVINNHNVEAVFETYIETGETFLKNAWVIAGE